MISQQELKNLLYYNPFTGLFTWKVGKCIGKKAGTLLSNGYIHIKINRKPIGAHRLAWLYAHGNIPIEINHINHNKSDNKLINLEPSDRSHNMRRKSLAKNNTSKVTGIYKERNLFRAMIFDNGIVYRYSSKDFFETVCWRKSKEVELNYNVNQ